MLPKASVRWQTVERRALHLRTATPLILTTHDRKDAGNAESEWKKAALDFLLEYGSYFTMRLHGPTAVRARRQVHHLRRSSLQPTAGRMTVVQNQKAEKAPLDFLFALDSHSQARSSLGTTVE